MGQSYPLHDARYFIIQRVADRNATVKVLDKPRLDLTTPMGKGILAFLSALAEDERVRITIRAKRRQGGCESEQRESQMLTLTWPVRRGLGGVEIVHP